MANYLRCHHLPSSSLAAKASSQLTPPQLPTKRLASFGNWVNQLHSKSVNLAVSSALALGLSLTFTGVEFAEAKVGVNKPELLPKEFSSVIDVAGFLSDGQSHSLEEYLHQPEEVVVVVFPSRIGIIASMSEKRLAQEITDIEKDTGFKLRVLAQNYPDTPGLAIKDFWHVDDRTIVFVADPTFGNILNFNVGASVDLDIPRSFWSRLAGKYGNVFYWKEKGEDASIEAAVMAISNCLREPVGPNNCSEVAGSALASRSDHNLVAVDHKA